MEHKVDKEYLSNASSRKFYDYLFNNKCEEKRDFRFIALRIEDEKEQQRIVSIFLDIFSSFCSLVIDEVPLVFYEEEGDVKIKDITSSIIDDFGIKVFVFNSGKITSSESFFEVFSIYKEYLRGYQYSSTSDLIIEVMKKNNKKLMNLKKIILNKVSEDSQYEIIIQAMFENNLNITKTAKSIYMHRNTINNKLNYIKKETGLNIQEFKDAISMYLLLKAK